MLTSFSSQNARYRKGRGQAIVEFAIALPILLMIVVGLLEVGRMVFLYAAVNNASRDAARFASAVGLSDGGTYNKYSYCAGIREVAKRAAFLAALADTDIAITYDKGPAYVNSPFDECPPGVTSDPSVDVDSGDRVTVTISTTYSPMVNLVPIGSRPIVSRSSRTILGIMQLAWEPGGTAAAGSIPTNVAATPIASTRTPTPTGSASTPETPSATPTAMYVYTLTPMDTPTDTPAPSSTPIQPSNTPKPTHTPKPSNTPRR